MSETIAQVLESMSYDDLWQYLQKIDIQELADRKDLGSLNFNSRYEQMQLAKKRLLELRALDYSKYLARSHRENVDNRLRRIVKVFLRVERFTIEQSSNVVEDQRAILEAIDAAVDEVAELATSYLPSLRDEAARSAGGEDLQAALKDVTSVKNSYERLNSELKDKLDELSANSRAFQQANLGEVGTLLAHSYRSSSDAANKQADNWRKMAIALWGLMILILVALTVLALLYPGLIKTFNSWTPAHATFVAFMSLLGYGIRYSNYMSRTWQNIASMHHHQTIVADVVSTLIQYRDSQHAVVSERTINKGLQQLFLQKSSGWLTPKHELHDPNPVIEMINKIGNSK